MLMHLLIVNYNNFADTPVWLRKKFKDNLPTGEIYCGTPVLLAATCSMSIQRRLAASHLRCTGFLTDSGKA